MSKQRRMRGAGHQRAALAAVLVAASLVLPATSAIACDLLFGCETTQPPERTPSWLRGAIDAYRIDHGLAELARDPELDALAKRHAKRMADRAEVFHNTRGLRARQAETGETLGENVGAGYDLGRIHDAFVASPSHRRTMLGAWKRLGLGVVERQDEIYVVEVFAAHRRVVARASTPRRESPTTIQRPRRRAAQPHGDPVLVALTPELEPAAAQATAGGRGGGIPAWPIVLAGAILGPLGTLATRRARAR